MRRWHRRHKFIGAAAAAIIAAGGAAVVANNSGSHSSSSSYAGQEPDGQLTPGVVDPASPMSIVCGQSTKQRRAVSQSTKNQVFAEYNVKVHSGLTYEVDHLIPLELGGSNDIKNLWPEAASPTPGFHQKDVLENKMHALVCSGKEPLVQAQHEIATDWVTAYNKYVLGK